MMRLWEYLPVLRCPACDGRGHILERLCRCCGGGAVHRVGPCDIAWAWLKLSCAQPSEELVDGEHDVILIERVQDKDAKRAAECAELAIIANTWRGKDGGWDVDAMAHDGTSEGARAAWGHVVQTIEMQQRNRRGRNFFMGSPKRGKAGRDCAIATAANWRRCRCVPEANHGSAQRENGSAARSDAIAVSRHRGGVRWALD